MFFEEGYVALSEATAEVFRRLQALQVAGKIVDMKKGLMPHLTVTVWDICEASLKIGTTAANGSFIEASKDVVAWADPRSLSNEHLDLRVGTVGSSTLPGDDGKMRSVQELEFRYGPFLSLPICIPANSFKSSLTFLEEQVQLPLYDEKVVNAAKVILEMVKAKKTVTREIARAKMGEAMSRRRLKLAWALASDHHPALAAPNRWQGLEMDASG